MISISKEDIQRLRGRDAQAVAALVHAHTPALLAAALGMGFSRADAEELAQDVFVAFLDGVERFQGRSAVKTFLFGILYNKASEMRRRRVREQGADKIEELFEARFDSHGMLMKPIHGPEEAALTAELSAWIGECLEGLSTQQRAAFYMKEVEGQDTPALCKILGVTVTHLGVILFRARNKLMLCLEAKMEKKP